MPQQTKYTNSEFIVKESATANFLIAAVFLVIAFLILINIAGEDDPSYFTLSIALLPAIVYITKGLNQKSIIRINKDGFYHYDTLKTNWANFISAESREDQRESDLDYQFVFIIRFYQSGEGVFELKIIMRNTFNRSGEEVIEAINYFRNPLLK